MNHAAVLADGRAPMHVLNGFLDSGKNTLQRHQLGHASL